MRTEVPTEAQEGRVLVAWLQIMHYRFTHIANETGANARFQGIRNKQQGVSRGFPDYLVITKKGLIAIELKRLKGSKTSTEQTGWIAELSKAGIPARVCKGAEEAINFIREVENAKS